MREDFTILEALDNGKPIKEFRADKDVCTDFVNFYANMADNFELGRRGVWSQRTLTLRCGCWKSQLMLCCRM